LIEARPMRTTGAVVLALSTDSLDRRANRYRRRALAAIGLALCAALVIAAILARRLSSPLTSTARAARRLAEGERGLALPSSRVREIADVTEALRHLDTALEASEDRQRKFLLSVSHELRTPLTAIRGYAEALIDEAVPADQLTQAGQTMLAEAQRLERYITDLLALARLEADDFAITPVVVDLAELLSATHRGWQGRARRADITLLLEVPPGVVQCRTDPERLRQALDILLDNAVRVCPTGAQIVLAVVERDDWVEISVRDSGPGLSDADLAIAFETGALHTAYAGKRPGGHGLGLALAARLVSRMGGTIRAEHADEGGAAFRVYFAKQHP
jgi:two-component system, OmpR family, sensor kinase